MPDDAALSIASAAPPKIARRARALLAAALLLLATGVLYLPLAGIPYFADDYEYVYPHPGSAVFYQFVHPTRPGGHWRPLKASWCALNQQLFGLSTFALEAGQALLHAVLAWLIYLFVRRRGIGVGPAVAAAGLFVAHSVVEPAVLGNDTGDQLLGTVCGFASFFCAWEFLEAGRSSPARPRRGWAVGTLALLGLSVLSKETSMAFSMLIPLALVAARMLGLPPADRRAWRGQVALAVGCVLVTGAYLLYRQHMAPVRVSFGETRAYDFQIGAVTPANLAMLFCAMLLPVSTVDVYVAFARHQIGAFALAAAFAAVWSVLLAVGAWRAERRRLAAMALVAAVIAAFPAVLLHHVSELYSYNMLPFLMIAVAVALEYLLSQRRHVILRAATWTLALAVVFSGVVGVWRKAALMQRCGEVQTALIEQIVSIVRDLPANAKVVLKEQVHPGTVLYSVYLISDFHELNGAEPWIQYRAQRPDVSIRLVREKESIPADATLVLVRADDAGQPRVAPLTPPQP